MTRKSIVSALAAVLMVAACDAAPTAARALDAAPLLNTGALTVSIIGPTDVTIGKPCVYLADAQGGVPPYQFRWRSMFTRTSWSTDIDFTLAAGRADFVEVTVRDATGQTAIASQAIQGHNTWYEC